MQLALLVGIGINQISVNPNFNTIVKMLLAMTNKKEVGRTLVREINPAAIGALRRMADVLSSE